jgi:hypothetical protein
LTTCETAVDVLPVSLLSPPEMAVMEWVPTDSTEVENDATPLLSDPVPRRVEPS